MYRSDLRQLDEEEQIEVRGQVRSTLDQGQVDIELAARFYPVRPERQLSDTFVERVMRLVQGQMTVS